MPATGSAAACAKLTASGSDREGVRRDGGAAAPTPCRGAADHARALRRPAAVGGGARDDAGEVPAREAARRLVGQAP